MFESVDRAIVRFNYGIGLWAIGTSFEPLMTSKPRVASAVDSDITAESLGRMEQQLKLITAGTRNWLFAGLGLVLVGPVVALTGSESLQVAVVLVLLPALVAWLVWITVAMLRWRKTAEWGLSDGLALALKQRTLGEESLGQMRMLPPDSLLLVALGPLLATN